MLTATEIAHLTEKARAIRISILEMLAEAGSGHTAGPLGMADIFTLLYFKELRHKAEDPSWPDRDRVVLSNGHICPVQYATMAHAGYFPLETLHTLRKFGSVLQGHPHREFLPASEVSSGPLGSGLGQAVGMAIVNQREGKDERYVYALLSDGEHEEGVIWESGMLAAKEKLDHLIAIIDRNDIQIDGTTREVMPLEPLADKWRAFNWHVQTVDGHDFAALHTAIAKAKMAKGAPSMIVAETIPGKGVADFENNYLWHGKPPTKEEAKNAIAELLLQNV